MGSLFSAPKVTNRATRNTLNSATKAASSASSNINQVSQNAASNISSTGAKYATGVTNAASAGAAGITGAVNQFAPGILAAGNAGADSLTQLSGNLNQYFTPINFNAGGLSATYNNGQYTVTPDAARQALINQLYGGYNDAATAFGNLRQQWTPGESALRDAQLQSIENARTANISDLRENMAKRGVLGSSFASDAQTRSNLDFENQKNNVISQTYLQELDAQHQLIGDQYTAAANAVSSKINELNLEGNLGQQLSSQAQDLFKQAAQLKAQLATDAAQLKLSSAQSAGQLGLAGATAAGQLGVQGATAAGGLATGAAQSAGNIASTGAANAGQVKTGTLSNVANTNANLSAEQAKLDAQAQAGVGQLLGTLALAPLTGGTSLLGMGANYLTGNPIVPAAPTGVAGTSYTTPSLFGGVTPYANNYSNGYFYTQPAGSGPVYY